VSQPAVFSTWEPNDPNELVSHVMIAKQIGMTDNYAVSIRWRCDLSGQVAWISQVSPVASLDLDAVNPEEMGIMAISDVSINATYIQNVVMPADIPSVFDPVVYHDLDGTGAPGVPVVNDAVNWVVIMCVSGMVTYFFNGVRRGRWVPKPPWATGDWAGVHIIGIDYALGAEPEATLGQPIVAPSPAVVDVFRAQSLA
jgi:hypothetical protein